MLETLYKLVRTSGNKKLGASVAKTYTTRDSCPSTCAFLGSGCFGENFHQKFAWDRMHETGHNFTQLLDEIGALPCNSNLRINVVGDYKDPVEEIPRFSQVVRRKKLKVLNYTHHIPTEEISLAVRSASYIVNFSTESVSRANEYLDKGLNVVVALPSTLEVKKAYRWGETTIVTCPAQLRDVTCENCMLCAKDRVSKSPCTLR